MWHNRGRVSMRAATFVPILILALSSIALQGACELDSSEDELEELSRAADLCGPDVASDSTTTTPLACELQIPTPPDGETFDPSRVNITIELDEVRMTIPHVESEAACDGRDGWYYSPNNLEPKSIVLCPSTCDSVQKATKAPSRSCSVA
jgi:hypothetical protein